MSRWLMLLWCMVACAAPDSEKAPPITPPTAPEPVVQPAPTGADSAHAWQVAPQRGRATAEAARRLVAVETGAHEAFDRVVFTFDGPLPAYEVTYADEPVQTCGAGTRVAVEGTPLVVRFDAAAAHTDEGQPTVGDRDRQPGLYALQTLRLTCDFEGEVAWVASLRGRLPFRVLTLGAPPRIVIDVAHASER